jgi:sodium-dependent dicarboxylate transporter 2/3/5
MDFYRKKIGFFSGIFIFALILYIPRPADLSPEALKVGAVASLMAIWWLTEAIPIPATALLPLALFPLLGISSSKAASAPYANHLIFLFIGGFFIAIAMEKWNLHKRIALQIINLVGTSPNRIILGFMVSTAFLSMWISNTATAMMMVPVGMAIIKQSTDIIEQDKSTKIDTTPGNFNFGTALMLSIAFSASIGGAATIIGTPPNTILVGLIESMYHKQIAFFDWMMIGVPLAAMMLFITWIYLTRFALKPEISELPGGHETIKSELKKLGRITMTESKILFVFLLVAISWITRGFIQSSNHMVHDSTIAIIGALLLFIIPVDFKEGIFILDWKAAKKVPWDIIILFGGGLSLAEGFIQSGLAKWIGSQLTVLQGSNYILLIIIVVIVAMLLTEVTSNTATSAMLIPVMGSIALGMTIHPYGPMIAVCIASSYAFMLPVATPPNAVVFGSKYVTIRTMARVGIILDIIGLIFIIITVTYLIPIAWNINLLTLPEWLH